MSHSITARRFACILLLVPIAGSGCFSYANVPIASLSASAPIRVFLNTSGSAELAPLIGARARWVDGDLLQADSGGLILSVHEVAIRDASPGVWAGERVTIPRSAIDSAGTRRLNGSQTTVAAVGFSAGLLLLRAAFAGIKQSIGNGGGGPPPGSQ